jgi:hypothetical protein
MARKNDIAKVDPEYYKTMALFNNAIEPMTPLDPDDLLEMERRFDRYRKACIKYSQPIMNQGAYFAIGITKAQADRWAAGQGGNPLRTQFIQKVNSYCGAVREQNMASGALNPIAGIFWQKNYDGLKDVQEVIAVNPNQIELKSTDSISRKYADVVDAEITETEIPAEEVTAEYAESASAEETEK